MLVSLNKIVFLLWIIHITIKLALKIWKIHKLNVNLQCNHRSSNLVDVVILVYSQRKDIRQKGNGK